jgi:RNA polymerase sigma factor (sigma-70 family)
MLNDTHPLEEDHESVAGELVRELRSQTQSESQTFASLQSELKRIARFKMLHERADHTLQPTALVNEAFIKIRNSKLPPDFWINPENALRVIAYAMEQILNDWADSRSAQKRGGKQRLRVPLDENQALDFADKGEMLKLDSELMVRPEQTEEVLGMREALQRLRQINPRQAKVLQLQFYCGLTQEETAKLLDVSVETVKLDSRKAKAFLKVLLAAKS